MLVVDASAVVPLLLDPTGGGSDVLGRTASQALHSPALLDLEVTSVLRRMVLRGAVSPQRGRAAVQDLVALPVERHDHRLLLRRCWDLRDAVSAYDAAYVALAEALGATLLTADGPLSTAPGLRCPVELLD